MYIIYVEHCNYRWRLFCNKLAEGERLPPTRGALLQASLRANYQAMVWWNDIIARPEIPDPEDGHGWRRVEGTCTYQPIPTLESVAPDNVMNVVSCQCSKSQCKSKCSCKKHGLKCTEMCKCTASEVTCTNTI